MVRSSPLFLFQYCVLPLKTGLLPLCLYRSSGVSSLGGGGSSHGIILPVPASSARGARVLLSR